MRHRRKILLLSSFIAAAVIIWALAPSDRARRAAEKTVRTLRKEGFKLELAEFDLTGTAEQRARADLMTAAGRAVNGILPARELDLVHPIATNAAIVLHVQEKLSAGNNDDSWSKLEAALDACRDLLDRAMVAANSSEIRFEHSIGSGGEFVTLYAPEVRSLGAAFGARTVSELRHGNHGNGFSNLLALTHLATAWHVDPVDTAQSLRATLVGTAERTLWEALQTIGWAEDELALLQREWERPDFFKDLAETAACDRAIILASFRREAQQPPDPGVPARQIVSEFFSSPANAWSELQQSVRFARYRKYGIYEAEQEMLLYYRDREVQFRQALTASTWKEMRRVAGVTNVGGLRSLPNGVRNSLTFMSPRMGFFSQGSGLFRRAADAEALRRLAVAALALERFRLQHSVYPQALDELAPLFLRQIPIDFMDGKPLRYRPLGSHFVLYSVGQDCIDDGGVMMRTNSPTGSFGSGPPGAGRRDGPDLLWPRPATPEEVATDEIERRSTARAHFGVPAVSYRRR